jgi:hypothetical protein
MFGREVLQALGEDLLSFRMSLKDLTVIEKVISGRIRKESPFPPFRGR